MTMEQHLKDETKKRSNLEAAEKPRKKPGRKPSTEKPKTKRAEQTRAAQRAFRERYLLYFNTNRIAMPERNSI